MVLTVQGFFRCQKVSLVGGVNLSVQNISQLGCLFFPINMEKKQQTPPHPPTPFNTLLTNKITRRTKVRPLATTNQINMKCRWFRLQVVSPGSTDVPNWGSERNVIHAVPRHPNLTYVVQAEKNSRGDHPTKWLYSLITGMMIMLYYFTNVHSILSYWHGEYWLNHYTTTHQYRILKSKVSPRLGSTWVPVPITLAMYADLVVGSL